MAVAATDGAPDTELVRRARDGDRDAVEALLEQHLDAVHDHVARWSQDAALAAAATIHACSALVEDAPEDGTPVRVWLLATARDRVVSRLHADTASGGQPAPIGEAQLAGVGPGGDPAAALAAWRAVAALDEPGFSAVDLHVRAGLTRDDAAVVLATAPTVVDQAFTTIGAPAVAAYATLAPARAPVGVRRAVQDVVDQRLGGPVPTRLALGEGALRGVVAALLLAVVVLGGNLVMDLRATPLADAASTSAVAAEPVPSPSAVAEPDDTATLDPLAAASPTPEPSPDPTVEPSPSEGPTVEVEPSPSPTPEAVPLALEIIAPSAGTAAPADGIDALGRDAAMVDVAAVVVGATPSTTVAWRSDVDPARVLLDRAEGTVELWLTAACQDTLHELRVTATDTESGQTATAAIEVLAKHTCTAPLEVEITAPAGGTEVCATADGSELVALVDVTAVTNTDGITWTWTSDKEPDGSLLDAASGTVRLTTSGGGPTVHLLTVQAYRAADESSATDTVQVTVAGPPCSP